MRPLRWAIVSMIFLGTVVNYVDRQSVAVLAPVLVKDLHLTNLAYARIGTCFLIAYAFTMWIWGAVFDRVGNRTGYGLATGWWSLAEMGHALARGAGSLSVARFALGAGEAGNWPGATRTIAEWFSERQRALGMGIANTGAALGSAAATPIVIWLQILYGWKAVFLITGLFGAAWTLAWLAIYPRKLRAAATRRDEPGQEAVPWGALLRRREVWGIIIGRFFGDPIWWLYLFWLPKYLYDARGFSLKAIAAAGWVPYAAAGVGCLAGGWLSGALLHRGWSVNAARKSAITVATVLMPVGLAAAYVRSPVAALACMSVTLFGFQFWVGNVQTLPSDFFPVGAVGSIAGFSGTAAAVGAAIFTYSIGWIVDHFSYTPVLVIAAVLGPLATLLLFLVSGRVRRIESLASTA